MREIFTNLRSFVTVICLTLVMAACGSVSNHEPIASQNSQPTNIATSEQGSVPTSTPVVSVDEQTEVSIYGSNEDLTALLARKQMIVHTSNENLVEQTLEALQQPVVDEVPSLWQDIHILSLQLTNQSVELNIDIQDEHRLGAPGELMLLQSLKQTLFQFEFVNEIEVKVNGQSVESLMGHVELDHPIMRDDTL